MTPTRIAGWVALTVLTGCQPASPTVYQGYVEAEPVFVAAQQSGQLTAVAVQRGESVAAGSALFSQDAATETARVNESRAQLEQAQAQAGNLATGKRAPEIAAIEARIKDARARRVLSAEQLARQQALVARGFVSDQTLDEARTQLARDDATLEQLRAELASARLPGRDAERAAAAAQVVASQAALRQNAIRLEQKSQHAPVAGRIDDVFHRAGEWASTGEPVVAILPPENIKVRFYVPETVLGALQPGQAVSVHCDGCAAAVLATIRFISATAEYTPPVLYSDRNRHRLMFLVEAWPQPRDAMKLHPGQPVDVALKTTTTP